MTSTGDRGGSAVGRARLSRGFRRRVRVAEQWVRARSVARIAPADRAFAASKAVAVSRWLDRATRYRVWFLTQGHLNCIAELSEQGACNEARVACEDVIDDCVALGRPLCAASIRAHGERARCLLWADRPDEAFEECGFALEAAGHQPSVGERWQLRYRYCLALARRDLGDLDGSTRELRGLVPDMVSGFGQDSAWMVTTVTQLAKNVARGGDPSTAIAMVSSMLPASSSLRGPMSREALTLRSKVARWSFELGAADSGQQVAALALADFTRAGLSRSAEACELRYDYAQSLHASGEVDYAIVQLTQLLEDLEGSGWASSGFATSARSSLCAWRALLTGGDA